MIDHTIDSEYLILENIYDSSGQDTRLRQRDLAHVTGISLGMTNAILRRLAQKGWITIRKLNSRTIHYAITLEGINEVIRRSYRYFKRTIKNMVTYKERINDVLYRAKKRNIATVFLVGTSDLDFIIEYGCQQYRMDFVTMADEKSARQLPQNAPEEQILAIYAEGIPEDSAARDPCNAFYLSRMVLETPQAARHGSGA